ncbi:MAG: peptidoglycan-associated lipoprotein Pal [Gammaproteobacteria bacterium]|nr:peptidoglycan-associated lipoprotein Pal [Gammaproteobacteria bacterium]
MTYWRKGAWIVVLLVSGLLTACASHTGCGTPEAAPVVVDERPAAPEPVSEPVAEPEVVEEASDFMDLPDGTRVAVSADGSVIRATVGFGFDEAEISSGDFRILQEHAARLNRNRDQSVSIEGHCDERGTREYNLALGERRAMAVLDFLLANGVRTSQMSTRSFGEERPLDTGSDEDAWAKNRRVELRYE